MPEEMVPKSAGVQQHMVTYNNNKGQQEPRDTIIASRITRSLSDRVSSYQSQYRKKNKTEAVTALLDVALYVMENASRLQDPEVVEYLRENLYNVQLVDDITGWPQDRVEAVIGALVSERERRLRLKLKCY
jgi:transposase